MGALTLPGPALMVTERGGPVPPQEVIQRLRAEVGPEFGLRFMANFDASHWAVIREWPANDVRWARVRSQEIGPEAAYDIIGYLPLTCPVEQAAGYVQRALKSYPIEEIRKLADKVSAWNSTEIPKQQVASLITDTLDDVGRAQRPDNPRRQKQIIEKVIGR
jgi:hypothetical protein